MHEVMFFGVWAHIIFHQSDTYANTERDKWGFYKVDSILIIKYLFNVSFFTLGNMTDMAQSFCRSAS